jgi:hypothetical protein
MHSDQLSESSSEYRSKGGKGKGEPLTRLVGHDRTICSANANTLLFIVNETEGWVNANAVDRTPVQQGHDGHQQRSNKRQREIGVDIVT